MRRIVHSITSDFNKAEARALANIAGTLAATDPDRAERIARSITMLAKDVTATGGSAGAQVKSNPGCSVNDRESPGVSFLTGT